MSGMSMSGPSARLQGAPVVAMTATILDAGSVRADGPDETSSATFYEPLHVPLVNVDVLVGEDEEDRGK